MHCSFFRLRNFFLIAFLGLTAQAAVPVLAQAQENGDLTGKHYKALSDPILYPSKGSYFQLFDDRRGNPNGVEWREARAFASEMTGPDGRRGRLAIIDDADLYAWILQNFDLGSLSYGGSTWIGLRYWCGFRKLTLSDGSEYSPHAFAAWDNPWYRDDGIRCDTSGARALPYMGVFIAGTTSQRWRATGLKKRMPFYLVEFPPAAGETPAAEAAAGEGASPR